MAKYPGMLGSSVDPEKLALTFKGLIVGIVPVLILVFKARGVEVSQDTILQGTDLIVTTFLACWSAVGAVMTLFGAARKAYYAFIKK